MVYHRPGNWAEELDEEVEAHDWMRWMERPVGEFISRRQSSMEKKDTLLVPADPWNAPANPSRSLILSRRTSTSLGRSDKHVRLTLPNSASPLPGASGTCLSLLGPNGAPTTVQGPGRFRRRRAVSAADHKSCALVQSKMKLGDIM